MKKIAFVCVHNSCRSQMAEAFIFTRDKIKEKIEALVVRIKSEEL